MHAAECEIHPDHREQTPNVDKKTTNPQLWKTKPTFKHEYQRSHWPTETHSFWNWVTPSAVYGYFGNNFWGCFHTLVTLLQRMQRNKKTTVDQEWVCSIWGAIRAAEGDHVVISERRWALQASSSLPHRCLTDYYTQSQSHKEAPLSLGLVTHSSNLCVTHLKVCDAYKCVRAAENWFQAEGKTGSWLAPVCLNWYEEAWPTLAHVG